MKKALELVNGAIKSGKIEDAFMALGYCKRVLEDATSSVLAHSLEVSVEEKPVSDFQEFCKIETEKLRRDIIAEEEKTLYKNRAISFKDEVCKRWPRTNAFMKKIFHAKGITNLEEFYDWFLIPENWWCEDWEGLGKDDIIQIHHMFMTLNEEAGCTAADKLIAYIPTDTRSLATRVVNYLNKLNIYTKSQLRWTVNNIGDIPYIKGISSETMNNLNNKVKEELAFHAV